MQETKYKLICVGGTGQMVLHYYLQLYLLGLIKHPFEAVVIDTDDVIASIDSARLFFGDLQFGADTVDGVQQEPISIITTPRVPAPATDKVITALTGRQEHEIHEHPVRAFFNDDTLVQTVNQGLYARPALSSVMSNRVFSDSALTPMRDSSLVFVGSVIGGTSGGILAPLVDAVQTRQILNMVTGVKMRAVLFGRYFIPDDNIIPKAVQRFNSNQVFVLSSVREALTQLHSYFIIGGTRVADRKRDPNLEKSAVQLPWPDTDDPYWEGVQAVEYLLTDVVIPQTSNFREKEVEDFKPPIDRARADEIRKQRFSLVDRLVRRKVVKRLAADPFAVPIWGNRLTDLLAKFWNIANKAQSGKLKSDFPDMVQDSLERLWIGTDERLGLRSFFPETRSESVSPATIAAVNWPTADMSKALPTLFGSPQVVAQRAAATILFTALQHREEQI
jgi:hypothetical protein